MAQKWKTRLSQLARSLKLLAYRLIFDLACRVALRDFEFPPTDDKP